MHEDQSYEAWIESKAGACPESVCAMGYCAHQPACPPGRCWRSETERDWPMPASAPTTPPDDEGEAEPHE